MDKIKVKVNYADEEYSAALSKALLFKSNLFEISDSIPDIILDESCIPGFQPVHAIVTQIMAKLNRLNGPAKADSDILYTAFTAAIGGGGLSTTALAYAKIKARIFDRKLAFVSYDPEYRNHFPDEDEYFIKYYDDIPEEKDFDEIVFDIPSTTESYFNKLDKCENRIIVLGFDEKRIEAGKSLFSICEASANSYINPPETFLFQNHWEDKVDSSDIHSQLGKELLDFARKLEGK